MKVSLPKNLAESFKRMAKREYPIEVLAIMLGRQRENGSYVIEELFYPPDQLEKATANSTGWSSDWYPTARALAREADLEVLGDIHSHCYDRRHEEEYDTAPSEGDWDRCDAMKRDTSTRDFLFAICMVTKTPRRMYSRIRFWPKLPKIDLQIT